MDCSLVVCTHDRAARLRRTLEVMGRISAGRTWELVVVENACTDDTGDVVEEFRRSAAIPVRHLVEPEPGLNRARNRGCEAARGGIVALVDDDCYPRSDYVDALMDVFDRHDVGFMGGRVLLHDPSDVHFTVRESEEPELLPAHTFPTTGFIIGSNMAFRREVFRAVGGFDPEIGVGTPFVCGDIDFCARASDRGFHGGYFPGPTVYHHHRRKLAEEVDRLRASYDRGRGAYYARTLLGCPSLRVQALKWWYWDLDIARPGQTRREIAAALHYLARRAGRWLRNVAPGRAAVRGDAT